jgi:hypothetical protein
MDTCRLWVTVFLLLATLGADPAFSRVKTQVARDKEYSFRPAMTWAWQPLDDKQVMMARTAKDDPKAARALMEPIILETVAAELTKRAWKEAADAPDVTLTYYLMLTYGQTTQTMGQFAGASQWALPPFLATTTSLEISPHGALAIDVSSAGKVVWRGVAETKVKADLSPKAREALLREGVRDLIKRIPRD